MANERKANHRGCFLASGLFFLALVIMIFGMVFWISLSIFKPLDSSATTKIFEVSAGDNIETVANNLSSSNLIRSPLWFKVIGKVSDLPLTAGRYELSASQTSWQIIQVLRLGLPISEEIKVTLIEGWRIEEYASKLIESGLLSSQEDFYRALVQSSLDDKNPYQRGFLFPDTYQFKKETPASVIVQRLFSNYKSRTAELSPTYEQMVIASIVEREALYDEDRAQIAGVYFNRLRLGMKLDADPTVQFAKANLANQDCVASSFKSSCQILNWWPDLSRSDYQQVDDPYNTYLNSTLPATPIANPGLASIEAAVRPAEHDFLYFVTDSEGRAHFAKTLAEHQANIAKFR